MHSVLEAPPRNADLEWREIASRGYTAQLFLDRPEVEALQQLHRATTPESIGPFFPSFFLPADDRTAILEAFRKILKEKIATAAPRFRIVAASPLSSGAVCEGDPASLRKSLYE